MMIMIAPSLMVVTVQMLMVTMTMLVLLAMMMFFVQVNLEYLARVAFSEDGLLYPDSVVGTDRSANVIVN